MSMIDRLKSPQAAIGLFVAGLLLFAVIGIARELGGATVAATAQNNVGRAVQRVEVVNIQPATIPALGTVQTDQHGEKWVYLGRAWVACQHIDPATYCAWLASRLQLATREMMVESLDQFDRQIEASPTVPKPER